MSDWYKHGQSCLMDELTEIAADGNEPEQVAEMIYSYLTEIGLIDYDIEKEILYDRYGDGDDG